MPCTLGEEWPIHLPSRVWTRGVKRKASVMLAIAHLLCVTRSPDDGAGFGGENDASGAAASRDTRIPSHNRASKLKEPHACSSLAAPRSHPRGRPRCRQHLRVADSYIAAL